MHIALNAWFWDQPHTGSGQYLRRLVSHLRKVGGHHTYSLVMPPHHPTPDEVPEGVQLIPTGERAQTGNFGKVWFEQRLFPQAVKRCGADLAHVPYWGPPLSCPVPLVTSVLDVIPLIYPEYALGWRQTLYTSLVTAAARGADAILTISQTAKLDIETHLGIPPERISVTYLAPERHFHPQMGREKDEAVREKYDLPDDYVLYLGGFDQRKRVEDVLAAYQYLAGTEGVNYPLVIAGKEPSNWGELPFPRDLHQVAEELDVSRFVQWIGFVEEADKPALYRMAQVFVFPSEYEGFGLPPLEAMASGTPVVAADTVINDEILEDAAYLVKDPREMGAAILALIVQKPFREAMVNQGLALTTQYRWQNTARQTLAVYERVLAR